MSSRSLSSVETSLLGLKDIRGGLEIDVNNKIVTRADRNALPDHQVRIVSGGGAGHEPGHAGFVGRGFLTTAISGAIFTSPPVQAILKAILHTAPPSIPLLLIVTNYSGDRLNFALAERIAVSRYGYKNIRTILVADDVALSDVPEQVGNRGLAGTILMHKIAGAMAEQGHPLEEEIFRVCEKVNSRLKTIGFSFVPNWNEMTLTSVEIGKGVHGERGAECLKDQGDLTEIIENMVERFEKVIPNGKSVIILINNLGGPDHVFQIICHEIIKGLSKLSLDVIKIIAGPLFTSLGNFGASVTLLELDQEDREILSYVEYKTDICWDFFKPMNKPSTIIDQPVESNDFLSCSLDRGVKVSGSLLQKILSSICNKIIDNRTNLNEMDQEFGDGDTGETVSRGARAVLKYVTDSDPTTFTYPYSVFKTISHLLSCEMGGSSGAILGIFFESAADAFLSTDFQSPLWLQLGNESVATAGRSGRGHRTLLDVLLAAQDSMEEFQNSATDNWSEFLPKLQSNCQSAALATKKMIPKSGRAVYRQLTEAKESKYPDPGATVIALIVDTVVETLKLQ